MLNSEVGSFAKHYVWQAFFTQPQGSFHMADDPKKTFEDRKTINLSERYEVAYWKGVFNTDAAGLRDLVNTYGKSIANIRAKKKKA